MRTRLSVHTGRGVSPDCVSDERILTKRGMNKMTSRWLAGWYCLAVMCGLVAHTAKAAPVVVLSLRTYA
jgi:hypothetical protein